MHIRTSSAALVAALVLSSCGGGGQPAGPRAGSPEWYWEATVQNYDSGDFPKALEHLSNAASGEGDIAEKAKVWKTVMTAGLALGHRELAEACKSSMAAKPATASSLTGVLQQAQRDSRQYAIELLEGLGDFEKTLKAGHATLAFPFPSGNSVEAPAIANLSKGDAVPEGQLADGILQTLRRNQIIAVTEMIGTPGEANAAQAKLAAGPVTPPEPQARLSITTYLVHLSPLFDTQMLNDPKLRKIALDRAEQWLQPCVDSEDEAVKAAAEKLTARIEDERRDMGGARRKLKRL